MIFENQRPVPPSAIDIYNANREFLQHQAAEEDRAYLGQLIEFIQQFQTIAITTAEGNRVNVLAQPYGEGTATATGLFPFQMIGYTEDDISGMTYSKVSIAYGEINQVAPSGILEGGAYVFTVAMDGIFYAAVTMDPDTREVVSFGIHYAVNEDSLPNDNESLINITIGRFYLDSDGTPVTFNNVVGNINLAGYQTIDQNGHLCLEYFHTYTRQPMPQDFLSLSVFGASSGSAMYLVVGGDTPSGDMLNFTDGTNELIFKWTDGSPSLFMYDGAFSSFTTPSHIAMAVGPNAEYAPDMWIGNGDGAFHIELPDTGWYNVGATDVTDGDIDLGPTGTVTIDHKSYAPVTFTAFDAGMNSFSMEVIGAPPNYVGSTTIWDSISYLVDESINTAIYNAFAGIWATATCNEDGTITIDIGY